MEKVDVVISVSKAEKDLIDALIGIISGLKQKQGLPSILSAQIPNLIKVAGEFEDLSSDLKDAQSIESLVYFENELLKVFFPQVSGAK